MARIDSYSEDGTITGFDQLLGVNKSDATTVVGTNLFNMDDIATYVNGQSTDPTPAVTEDTDSVNVSKNVEIDGNNALISIGGFTSPSGNIIRFLSDDGSSTVIQHLDSRAGLNILATGPIVEGFFGISTSSFRGNNVYLQGPIRVGTDDEANEFDDYEEGTWTPTAVDLADAFGGNDFTLALGNYTKTGRIVNINGTVTANGNSDSSQIQIGGLPFTGSATFEFFGAAGPTGGSGDRNVAWLGTTALVLAGFTYQDISGSSINFSITYETTA